MTRKNRGLNGFAGLLTLLHGRAILMPPSNDGHRFQPFFSAKIESENVGETGRAISERSKGSFCAGSAVVAVRNVEMTTP